MNQKQIKALEAKLWDSANTLRATSKLTAAEYKDPVLGLILLRYAQNRFEQAKQRLEQNLPALPPGRTRKPLSKEAFKGEGAMFIPEAARYDYLANLPESESISEKINEAMLQIEADNPALTAVLPRNYQEMDDDLLRELIRVFNSDEVKGLTGDVFGRIYEFFLMKFSMDGAGAQEGGEFFTPPALVQLIVNLMQPDHGVIHDPACGSGGMFVQTGHFLEENVQLKKTTDRPTFYGSELKANNVRLAKMNLAIHGLEGNVSESNSFYADPHSLVGQCDFVMANPPFNVKKVDKDRKYVKQDPRLFGKPVTDEEDVALGENSDNKTKNPKATQRLGLPKADNGNYLWIQYFYHYLNEQGRAGFVMASSATDAGNTEKLIRQELIDTYSVDCIVSVGNNFFYTRSLPCHVWFLDKGKRPENQKKILMIDARNTYRTVTSTINDYSPGQLVNFSAMMAAYRGDEKAIQSADDQHESNIAELAVNLNGEVKKLRSQCQKLISDESYSDAKLDFSAAADELAAAIEVGKSLTLARSCELRDAFEQPVSRLNALLEQYRRIWTKEKKAFSALKKSEQTTDDNKAKKKRLDAEGRQLKALSAVVKLYLEDQKEELANLRQAEKDWRILGEYFPDGIYQDVEGLCKIVDLTEVAENDFSLTPGRYVGYRVEVDEDFDYQGRMAEINEELGNLNVEANHLMSFIEGVNP